MNRLNLLGIVSLLLSFNPSKAQSEDWKNDIKEINSKLSAISSKLMQMDRMSNQIDVIKLALDLINSKLDNSRRVQDETEKNVKKISEICFGNNKKFENEGDRSLSNSKEIEINLANKIDHYGNKMLREQQNVKNSSVQQIIILYDIRNVTISGLNKMLTKFETFIVSFNQQINQFSGISTQLRDLVRKSNDHELQLTQLEKTLTDHENWFNYLKETSKFYFTELWTNISAALDNKRENLSPKALLHVTKAVNQSKTIIDEVDKISELLEPKYVHVTRISEMINNKLKEKKAEDISVLANNLKTALQQLRDTTPSMILPLSTYAKSLHDDLLKLKNMENSNKSQCESYALGEIHKQYIEISKYINESKHNIKITNEKENIIWNEVMNKLNNIPKKVLENNDGTILQKLKQISKEIKECRDMLNKLHGENVDDNFDTTFG